MPSSPPRRSSRPLAISGYHPSYSQPTDHPTQSRRGTPVSPSVNVGCGCFSQVRPADTPREAAASTCTCGALLEMPNVLGSAGSWSFVLSNRWGCGGLAVRGDCTSSPPSPLPLSLPFKLLRRHHRARARGAARRHAMGGYYRDRDRGSDRDRRPADREESSDLRRRSGGATRCSAVTRDGGGCGMAAAAGRGCHAAARVVVALA